MYIINQNSKTPLHIQLYTQIKNDIIENYNIGDKLPSIRKVGSLYNLSKNTVENAYTQLVAEGYIESYPKSGYIVEDNKNFSFEQKIDIDANNEKKENWLYDFDPTRLSKDTFPIKVWKRLFNKYINESIDFGAYNKGQGEEGLRKEVAKYVSNSRGVNCYAHQIIIGCGFSNSMGLLAQLIQKKYHTLSIENPGYNIAARIFSSHGYNIKKMPIDKNGIKIDEIKKSKSKLIYVTPSHQYPTGVTIPVSNRHKLLELAEENDGLIIEDDYDSELSYINRPIPSLQGLDKFDRVVYIGTFSKSLSAPLRISYMVLPERLLDLFHNHYYHVFSNVPIMMQKTLEMFMKEGHWDRHLRKIRTMNRKKHNLMKSLLIEKLGKSMKIEVQGSGLSILINPTINLNIEKLKKLAIEKRIKIYFADKVCGGDWNAIRMGFGVFNENEIENAVEIFSSIWYEAIG